MTKRTFRSFVFAFGGTLTLSACGGDGDGNAAARPATQLPQTVEDVQALNDTIQDILDRRDLLDFDALPAGSANYAGIMFKTHPDDPAQPYWSAEIDLAVDFETLAINGELSGFSTMYRGLTSPDGTIIVSGAVQEGQGNAGYEFFGSGNLTQTDTSARLDVEGRGGFFEQDGGVMLGEQYVLWTGQTGDLEGFVEDGTGNHLLYAH